MKTKLVFFTLIFTGSISLALYQYARFFDGRLHVIFCDVGQGDAVLVRTPEGADILIDTGRDESVLDCLSRYRPFWDRSLDLMILTHPDADHIGGSVEVLKRFQVDTIASNSRSHTSEVFQELISLIGQKDIPHTTTVINDRFVTSDGVKLVTLWPPMHILERSESDNNELSLIHLLTYREFDVLFTGDADVKEVNAIMSKQKDLEVMKISHHGSYTGTDEDTFRLIKPGIAVISSGKNNRYGHPHQRVLDVLHSNRVNYKRTDEHGNVEIISDGSTTRIRTAKSRE